MNKVFLIGRLTKDPECRQIPTGSAFANFTVAVDRPFSSRDGERAADFIPVVTWNKTAENCAKYLTKGSKVGVSGRIQTRSYTANDGSKRYVTEVVADEVEFLSSRSEQQGRTSQQGSYSQQGNYSQQYNSQSNYSAPSSSSNSDPFYGVPIDGFEEIDDLDVPF